LLGSYPDIKLGKYSPRCGTVTPPKHGGKEIVSGSSMCRVPPVAEKYKKQKYKVIVKKAKAAPDIPEDILISMKDALNGIVVPKL
jgi:hypothetical protein